MIFILSAVNTVVFCYLFYLHLRANLGSNSWTAVFMKVKTTLLWLLILLNVLTAIRYGLYFTSFVYNTIIIMQQFLQSLILFQICYFYTKKAAHFVEDNKRIRLLMRIVMYGAAVIYTGLAIYQIVIEVKMDKFNRSNLCHSVYFLLTSFFNQLANCFFIFVGCRVRKTV